MMPWCLHDGEATELIRQPPLLCAQSADECFLMSSGEDLLELRCGLANQGCMSSVCSYRTRLEISNTLLGYLTMLYKTQASLDQLKDNL
jgi:hypothetical protein